MTRYSEARRILTSKRNPEGVRVGQTWYAKNICGVDSDQIEITAVFSEDLIHVKDKSGKDFRVDSKRLKHIYSLSENNELF